MNVEPDTVSVTEAVIVRPATLQPIGPGGVIEKEGCRVSTVSVVHDEAVQPLPVFVTVAQYWPAAEVVKEEAVEAFPVQEYVYEPPQPVADTDTVRVGFVQVIGPLLVAATVGRHVSTVSVVQEDAVQPFPVFVTVAQY